MKEEEYYQQITKSFIELLKKGTIPWQKPWNADLSGPYNPVSQTVYSGINILTLEAKALTNGYNDPRWLTIRQANSINAQVRKGESGTPVIYWKYGKMVDEIDEDGNPVLDEEGNQKQIFIPYKKPASYVHHVFNAMQVDNMPPLPPRQEKTWNTEERAEKILENSEAVIEYFGSRAFYSPKQDKIVLPPKEFFESANGFYSTALHELGHWTGHPTRLDRGFSNSFGSPEYAKEELRAEISSYFVCGKIGIPNLSIEDHASYINGWIKNLENDPKEIINAARDAEKISKYVLAMEHQNILDINRDLHLGKFDVSYIGNDLNEDSIVSNERVYLDVSYNEKNEAKAFGAKWDNGKKQWYAPAGVDLTPLENWLPEGMTIDKIKEMMLEQKGDAIQTAHSDDPEIDIEPLTGNETGVAGLEHTSSQIMMQEDWQAGKNGDFDAARRAIDRLWTDDKTEALKKRLDDKEETIFVTVPSSSRKNQIPLALAEKLTEAIGGSVVDGSLLVDVKDDREMKNIQKKDRPFAGRHYDLVEDSLSKLQGNQIVVVEDIISTGASAYAFVLALKEQKIKTKTLAVAMGDPRLTPEPQLVSKFQNTLKRLNVPVKAKKLADHLSRGEVIAIIKMVNETSKKEEKDDLAKRIQGIYSERVDLTLGSNPRGHSTSNTRARNENPSDEFLTAGIQASPSVLQDERGRREGEGDFSRDKEQLENSNIKIEPNENCGYTIAGKNGLGFVSIADISINPVIDLDLQETETETHDHLEKLDTFKPVINPLDDEKDRVYLNVPGNARQTVIDLGAKYDPDAERFLQSQTWICRNLHDFCLIIWILGMIILRRNL